jgi:hypothetical protein
MGLPRKHKKDFPFSTNFLELDLIIFASFTLSEEKTDLNRRDFRKNKHASLRSFSSLGTISLVTGSRAACLYALVSKHTTLDPPTHILIYKQVIFIPICHCSMPAPFSICSMDHNWVLFV